MKQYEKKKPLFSLHIHKCGGTSMALILKKLFPFGYWPHYYKPRYDKKPLKVPMVNFLSNFFPICIHGHFDRQNGTNIENYYPSASQYITILRDPLDIAISNYFYVKQSYENDSLYVKGKKVDNFPHLDIDNYLQTCSLNLFRDLPFDLAEFTIDHRFDLIKQFIDQYFVHIGILERFNDSIIIICEKLNKRRPIDIPKINVSKYDEEISQSARDSFINRHKLEYLLYNFAATLN